MTDELLTYDALDSDYADKVINHAERYVDGNVHTNRMENFWSLSETRYRRYVREC
jgi:hypothetical protein